jgi:Methylamine utilisation protein MauE.
VEALTWKVGVAILILSGIFSLLFFSSFMAKLLSFRSFLYAIVDFEVIGKQLNWKTYLASIAVLGLELLLGVTFSLNILLGISFIAAFLLLSCFSFLFLRQHRSKKPIKCSCFGRSDKFTNQKLAILRNTILAILALIGLGLQPSYIVVDQPNVTMLLIYSSIACLYQLYVEWTYMNKLKKEAVGL